MNEVREPNNSPQVIKMKVLDVVYLTYKMAIID